MARPQVIYVTDLAEALDKSESTIYDWIKKGRLETSQDGNGVHRIYEFQLARAIGREAATEVFDEIDT
jgi:predicted site-specific integrase-resolvase